MATIRIMSGGAPKEIFLQLTPQFERQSGHKVDYVFAVMSALRDKLAAGEKADVLVMPTNILDGYQKDNVVRAQGRAVLGLVSINAVVRRGTAKPDLSTPEKVKQAMLNSRAITHATPGATPSGTHMGKLVEQLGIADAMKGKIVHRPALEGGVQLVANGEAEIGF
jgi:molybdate transport system substrate-binding protein